MPCYDERGSGGIREVRVTPKEYRHNSPVAEMLCGLCRQLEKRDMMELLGPKTRKWWAEHKRRDAERK
jgi:hypothetical protein